MIRIAISPAAFEVIAAPGPVATPEAAAPVTGMSAPPVSESEPRRSWARWWFRWKAA